MTRVQDADINGAKLGVIITDRKADNALATADTALRAAQGNASLITHLQRDNADKWQAQNIRDSKQDILIDTAGKKPT